MPIYGSGGWTSFDERELVREQVGYVERGIPRVKTKVAKDFGRAEAEDLRRLAAVRKAVFRWGRRPTEMPEHARLI